MGGGQKPCVQVMVIDMVIEIVMNIVMKMVMVILAAECK